MAETGVLGRSYGDLLVSLGVLSEDGLNRGLAIQSNQGGDLDAILVENEIVSLETLQEVVSSHLGIETINIKDAA
ncbi:MAG: hypothetical protein HUU16_04565, partial [Candidatus Omnitrophica bacterium]|nr:hypothetical protein [Candidatus Omnitrophota bacterium]